MALAATLLLVGAVTALAQTPVARLGFSAAPDAYVESLTVENGEEFTLYVVATGMPGEGGVPFDVAQFRWSVLQACCGSTFLIQDVEFNPEMEHEGNPFAGVISHSETCLTDEFYWIATIRFVSVAEESGPYVAGCIPLDVGLDCDGNEWTMLGMDTIVVVTFDGEVANENATWSEVRRQYR
jgi:hypothetical protein